MKISLSIPGKPVGKDRPRFDPRSGRVYTPTSTADAELAIAKAWMAATVGRRPFTGPVKLTIIAVFEAPPSWPKRLRDETAGAQVWQIARGEADLDNIIKLVSDALNRKAYVDDAQVAVITCGKRYGSPARTDISVEALPQPEAAVTPGQRALEARVALEGWDKVLAPAPKRANRSKGGRPAPRRFVRGFARGEPQ